MAAKVGISKPAASKWFSSRSFKLCRGADATPPTPKAAGAAAAKRSKEREFREVFRHFDRDRDGKISGEELRAFFLSAGEDVSLEEAQGVIGDLDSDGDGLLGFGDFMALMERGGSTGTGNGGGESQKRVGEQEEEDLRTAFEMFEGAGRITARGLQRVLCRLGDERTVEECEGMIRAYDLDGNGELSFLEFRQMMG